MSCSLATCALSCHAALDVEHPACGTVTHGRTRVGHSEVLIQMAVIRRTVHSHRRGAAEVKWTPGFAGQPAAEALAVLWQRFGTLPAADAQVQLVTLH